MENYRIKKYQQLCKPCSQAQAENNQLGLKTF